MCDSMDEFVSYYSLWYLNIFNSCIPSLTQDTGATGCNTLNVPVHQLALNRTRYLFVRYLYIRVTFTEATTGESNRVIEFGTYHVVIWFSMWRVFVVSYLCVKSIFTNTKPMHSMFVLYLSTFLLVITNMTMKFNFYLFLFLNLVKCWSLVCPVTYHESFE